MKKEEDKKSYGWLIFIAVIVILFIPIVIDYVKKQNIAEIDSNEVLDKIDEGETFILTLGEVEKDQKRELIDVRDKDMETYQYGIENQVYTSSYSNDFKDLFDKDTKYAVVIDGDIQKTYKEDEYETLQSDINKYFLGEVSDKEKSYKVAENYKAYKDLVKSDKVTMAVFGRDSCYYCNLFKPVYNAVAEKYNLDIYFFDSDSYDKEEYEKIINMDLTIPAKCNQQGTEFKLSDGFGTPLTVFTKKGKVIDCIAGYVDRTSLIETLKENEMLSE